MTVNTGPTIDDNDAYELVMWHAIGWTNDGFGEAAQSQTPDDPEWDEIVAGLRQCDPGYADAEFAIRDTRDDTIVRTF